MATAVVPIVLLLTAGAAMRRKFVTDAEFWRGLEWMSYHVFTPALFVSSIAGTEITAIPIGSLLLCLAAPVVGFALLVVGSRKLLRANGPQLTSLVQGSIRINTYIGLVFASALHGREGVATFALAAAVMVPLVNIISVTALSVYGNKAGREPRRGGVLRELVENPLIQGCVVGLLLSVFDVGLPSFIAATVQMLAAPALVCGTLVAGAAISFRLRRRDAVDIGVSSAIKLIALPFASAAIATSVGVDGATLASIVIICAVPTAPSAFILAGRMGGDTRLMASITGAQTVLAVATLPIVLGLVTTV